MKSKLLMIALVTGILLAACQPTVQTQEAAPTATVTKAVPTEAVTTEKVEDPIALALEFADRAAAGEKVAFSGNSDVTLAVVMPALDNDGWRAIYIGVLSKVIELGVDMITLDARDSVEKQIAIIEDLITQQVDAIIFVPVDSAALSTAVQRANEAGIPVVTMDRSTEGGEVVALVESNNVEIGAKGAELMAEVAAKQGVALEDLVVLELLGDLATSAGKERHEGFSTKAKELGLNVVAELPTNWNAEKANAAILDAFQAHPDINAIYIASGCALFSGVDPAMESLGKWVPAGEPGHIIFISTDGCPAPLEAIRAGKVDADSAQQLVTMGQIAVETAVNAVNGKMPENPIIRLGPDPITPDNVDDMFHWANAVNTAK
jgi:ribose transport system substrate-binding protein